MKNNILEQSNFACSGCGACACICPKNAIEIQLDASGFYTAKIDENKCINCGLCKTVCTRYEETVGEISLYDSKVYAAQSSNEDVIRNSSSGGIACELSRWVVQNGYKVIGVTYDTEKNSAEHIIISAENEIVKLSGSKYLQSNPEKAFKEAVELAVQSAEERFVVFGTPCQISGLKKVIEQKRIRKQFLLVEIFCHGVPSYKLWQKQCEKIQKKLGTNKFDSVIFRYKKDEWHNYCLRVDSGTQTFFGEREKELFWQVYFENILLSDSCYHCRMRKEMTNADIRLGDYWGKRYQEREDGVSVIFAPTEKGNDVISQLSEKKAIRFMECGDAEEILRAQNMRGYHQKELHDKAMNALVESGDIQYAVKISRKGMTGKQKLKRKALRCSTFIPKKMRKKMRSMYRKVLLRR